MLLDAHRRRFAGRADRADALRAFGDVPVDEAAQRVEIDAPSSCIGVTSATMLPVMGFMGVGWLNPSILATRHRRPPRAPARPADGARGPGADLAHRGDALHESVGVAQEAVFECHDAQTRGDAEKFTAGEQKVGPRRPADGLVAGREGLVEQDAAGADRGGRSPARAAARGSS